jgi:hypothetical protein
VANSKGNYDSITDEIYRLRKLKQSAMVDSAEREGLKLRIDEMQQFLDEQTESITEYDEQLTRRLIVNPAQAWMSTDKYRTRHQHLAAAGCFAV